MTVNNEKVLKENIQKNLVFYRKRKRFTQKTLAAEIGCTAAAISSWECGNNSPDIDTLVLICNILEVGLYEMCGISPNKTVVPADESRVLRIYRDLNEDGRKKLIERAEELRNLGYVKGDMSKMA